MRRLLMMIVALVFLGALLLFTTTYQVRFTEAAVLTTFGKAGDHAVKRDAGLHLKWPYPIQAVTTYDTRLRPLSVKLETQQTADSRQITVEGFCTWRVADPLKFFQRFSNAGGVAAEQYAAAQRVLESSLRAAMARVSKYRMNELFAATPGASKLPELEAEILQAFRAASDKSDLSMDDYGIEAVAVGISRIVLPESVTPGVLEAMKAERARRAQEIQSRGEAQAQAIRSRAESDAKRIRDFAELYAQTIRKRGDEESAPFLARMNENADLAAFLENIRIMREMVSARTTLVLPSSMPGLELIAPDAMSRIRNGGKSSDSSTGRWLREEVFGRDPGRVASASPESQPLNTESSR
ncbi:MAG: SPFH domain-containing protein [Phycisphaerales bacterium]